VRIVLLHGIGGNAAGFAGHVQWFESHGVKVLAIDQPGYGAVAPIEPYTFEALADRLILTLGRDDRKRGIRPPPTVLVGHSMGGMLAQMAAIRNAKHPQPMSLKGLVLANTSPAFGSTDGVFQQKFVSDRTTLLDAGQSMRDVAKKMVPTMVGPQCDLAIKNGCIEMMSVTSAQTYKKALAALTQFDARPHLASITIPVLCLAAQHDQTAPPSVLEKLAQKLPNARYQCLEGLGHLAPFEDTEKFCSTVWSFVQSIQSI
jgi:3-oxoadipate enol-lactonase